MEFMDAKAILDRIRYNKEIIKYCAVDNMALERLYSVVTNESLMTTPDTAKTSKVKKEKEKYHKHRVVRNSGITKAVLEYFIMHRGTRFKSVDVWSDLNKVHRDLTLNDLSATLSYLQRRKKLYSEYSGEGHAKNYWYQ